MITTINIPLAMWLLYPAARYHYAGGQSGPYGDQLDAIRLDDRAPDGEPLLTALPTESDIIRAALEHSTEHPTIINWPAIAPGQVLELDGELIALDDYRPEGM